MSVIDEIVAERKRQIEVEGFTPEHDDEHDNWQLSSAAVCYGNMGNGGPFSHPVAGRAPWAWPRGSDWWKPSPDPRRNLVKAAALLVAEIERLDRAEAIKDQPND